MSKQLKKNITLSANISPTVPKVMVGDKNRISQVMFNLIGNAIKFTNQGSVSIDVSCNNKYAEIAVKDTGIGISSDAQKNLFNPFIQADGSITRRYGGTGLGLAISQHLIDKMNGKITLKSTLNEGSCFTVYIPIIQAAETSMVEEPAIEASVDRSLSILLAEDSNTNQLVAKLMLEKRGHRVVIANNGKEAIEILENNRKEFDIVLMDISMPVLDGLQATKQLRENNVDIPIIALTANAMHSDQIEYEKAGMNDFLAKPILAPELNAMLNKYQALAITA